jgi:hypothetical protein
MEPYAPSCIDGGGTTHTKQTTVRSRFFSSP